MVPPSKPRIGASAGDYLCVCVYSMLLLYWCRLDSAAGLSHLPVVVLRRPVWAASASRRPPPPSGARHRPSAVLPAAVPLRAGLGLSRTLPPPSLRGDDDDHAFERGLRAAPSWSIAEAVIKQTHIPSQTECSALFGSVSTSTDACPPPFRRARRAVRAADDARVVELVDDEDVDDFAENDVRVFRRDCHRWGRRPPTCFPPCAASRRRAHAPVRVDVRGGARVAGEQPRVTGLPLDGVVVAPLVALRRDGGCAPKNDRERNRRENALERARKKSCGATTGSGRLASGIRRA